MDRAVSEAAFLLVQEDQAYFSETVIHTNTYLSFKAPMELNGSCCLQIEVHNFDRWLQKIWLWHFQNSEETIIAQKNPCFNTGRLMRSLEISLETAYWLHEVVQRARWLITIRPSENRWDVTSGLSRTPQGQGWSTFSVMPSHLFGFFGFFGCLIYYWEPHSQLLQQVSSAFKAMTVVLTAWLLLHIYLLSFMLGTQGVSFFGWEVPQKTSYV